MAEGGSDADRRFPREDRGGSGEDRSAGIGRIGVSPLGVIPDPLLPSPCAGEEGEARARSASVASPQTRARAGAREAKPVPRVVVIRLAPGERRTPLALADVALGDLTIRFALARLRRGKLDVRPPEDPYGGPALKVPPDLRDRIVAAVVEAAQMEPEVWRVLRPRW